MAALDRTIEDGSQTVQTCRPSPHQQGSPRRKSRRRPESVGLALFGTFVGGRNRPEPRTAAPFGSRLSDRRNIAVPRGAASNRLAGPKRGADAIFRGISTSLRPALPYVSALNIQPASPPRRSPMSQSSFWRAALATHGCRDSRDFVGRTSYLSMLWAVGHAYGQRWLPESSILSRP